MHRFLAPLLASTALLGTSTANADVIQRYSAGSWQIEANTTRGSFENCTATGQYGGGASVMFMLTRTFTWGVAITNPRWNWEKGTEGNVSYWVDAYQRRQGRVRALASTELMVLLADSQQLFQEIRAGDTMYFEPQGADRFSITLVGTSVALNELMVCVRNHR